MSPLPPTDSAKPLEPADAKDAAAAPNKIVDEAVDSGFLANFRGKSEYVFQYGILGLICVLAFMVRLFSVLRYESMIHEFDPWFNFRSTIHLVEEGFYSFHNYFDDRSWYPLGRFVGGTVYPGLMWTAGVIFNVLHYLHFPVVIRNICVFISPLFASFTCLAIYALTTEIAGGACGIFAAFFISIAPGYISRSVAGSYDNECVAIFALCFAFFTWVRAAKTGSLSWAAVAAMAYGYMVSTWGGYIFIINLVPAHVFALLLAGKFSSRIYCAYCVWYPVGTLLSMQIPFVQFIPVSSPEHFAALGVFGLLQLYMAYYYLQGMLPDEMFSRLLRLVALVAASVVALFVVLAALGRVPFLTGRLWSLLGATSNIAIVKSVSEHQPSPWGAFFNDLHCLVVFAAGGLYHCFRQFDTGAIFGIMYLLFASYFSSIMIRLILVLTPIVCVLGGIGASRLMELYTDVLMYPSSDDEDAVNNTGSSDEGSADELGGTDRTIYVDEDKSFLHRTPRASKPVAMLVIGAMVALCFLFTIHCNWVTSSAYSSPSIVLQSRRGDQTHIFDDFREAYYWLRKNTGENDRVMSWWDYGYQITGLGNRTVIVDNNTRNNTHIATVGLAMSSNEDRAWEVMRMLDVDYVLVVFGGYIGYSSDDINKFLWMVRISGGIFPEVVERDYYNVHGGYRVDNTAPPRMLNSLMYKLCYHRFGEVQHGYNSPKGYDRTRGVVIGDPNVKLEYVEEAFTSEHWMVRIYRVKTEKTHPRFLKKIEQRKLKRQVKAARKKGKKNNRG